MRGEVVQDLSDYYSKLFSDHPDFQPLREDYAIKENPVPDASRRQQPFSIFLLVHLGNSDQSAG